LGVAWDLLQGIYSVTMAEIAGICLPLKCFASFLECSLKEACINILVGWIKTLKIKEVRRGEKPQKKSVVAWVLAFVIWIVGQLERVKEKGTPGVQESPAGCDS
jgi:hypothetical protein